MATNYDNGLAAADDLEDALRKLHELARIEQPDDETEHQLMTAGIATVAALARGITYGLLAIAQAIDEKRWSS